MKEDTDGFVARLASRAYANSTRTGSHHAAFLAAKERITAGLEAGYPMRLVWGQLRDEKVLKMNYDTFRSHCKAAGLRRLSKAATRKAARRVVTPTPAAAPTKFTHNPVPDLKAIYGDDYDG